MEGRLSFWSEFNRGSVLWLGDWGAGWLVLFALLSAVVLAATWLDLRELAGPRRLSLLVLRALALGTAVFVLLEPALELKHVTVVPNHIAVLVDASTSQTLPAAGNESRAERTRDALSALQRTIQHAEGEHRFDVVTLQLGEPVDPDDSAELVFDEPNTEILERIDAWRETLEADDIGGIVLLSDGIDNGALGDRVRRGEELDTMSLRILESLDTPIHTFASAEAGNLNDIAVRRVLRDDFAFVRNAVSVTADLRVLGRSGENITVTLYREGEPLQTRQVAITDDNADVRVDFEFVPQTIGKEIYHVESPVLDGEALASNNRSFFVLNVIRDQIRVLQVVGRPSWDVRFMRQFLQGNPNVDLISFFILRTNDDLRRTSNTELSLIPFPTEELFEEQLGSFDLVIFQNFNYGPYNMASYLPRVARYVEDGGGLLMTGGELSFASGGYSGTDVADVLPVTLPPSGSGAIDYDAFRPELTEAGVRHPVTRLIFDRVENNSLWQTLPEMNGTNVVTGLAPGATALATHPTRSAGGEPMPVIAVREVGEGRSMAVTVDNTWRWTFDGLRAGVEGDPFASFYNSAIRWLIRDPELNLVQVELPDEVVSPGEPLSGTVRVLRADYSPHAGAEGSLRVWYRPLDALADGPGEIISETPFTSDDQGRYTFTVPLAEEGAYRVDALVRNDEDEPMSDDEVALCVRDMLELRDIEARPELLRALSDATGGQHVTKASQLDDLTFRAPRVEAVDRRVVVELWNAPWLLLLVALLLGGEWLLRRRWGRL
ncbi:MAG: putative membrane protein [Flavobacteriales bacterium]